MDERSDDDAERRPLSRRRLLSTVAALAIAGATGGCGPANERRLTPGSAGGRGSPSGSAAPSGPAGPTTPLPPDVALVAGALGDERHLLGYCTAAAHAWAADVPVLSPMASQQSAHVTRLRATLPARLRRLRPLPAPHAPASAAGARSSLVAHQESAATGRGLDCMSADEGLLAGLMASIAACHAAAAVSLGAKPADPPAVPVSTTQPGALQPCLAAEHAAVYGYGLLSGVLKAGYVDSPLGDQAVLGYDVHRTRRDGLMSLIAAAGLTPVAAQAAYRVPFAVTGAGSARRLARLVESRCAAVYARAVGDVTGPSRRFCCAVLSDCATRGFSWGAPPTPFPGLTP